jgi:hypothetical protein
MIYRVGSRCLGLQHWGYEYFTTKKEAEKAWRIRFQDEDREGKTFCTAHEYFGEKLDSKSQNPWGKGTDLIEAVPAPKTQAEVVDLLNRWAFHPDNG